MLFASNCVPNMVIQYSEINMQKSEINMQKSIENNIVRDQFEIEFDYLTEVYFDLIKKEIVIKSEVIKTDILSLASYEYDKSKYNFMSNPKTLDRVIYKLKVRAESTGRDYNAEYVGEKCKITDFSSTHNNADVSKFKINITCGTLSFKIGDEIV